MSVGLPVDASSVQVTLTRASDGRSWNFSSSSAEGSFYVNNSGYGTLGCIIFRPESDDFSIGAGDSFRVRITGATTSGSAIDLDYTVNFFKMSPSTVRFDSRGGSEVPSQEVMPGDKAQRPTDPVDEGFVFTGWYVDVACTTLYDFDQPVMEDIRLYAGWEPMVATEFWDTPAGEWYMTEGWITYAATNGLMSGYTNADGSPQYKFGPEDEITRGQAVTVLYRIANPGSTDTINPDHFAAKLGLRRQRRAPVLQRRRRVGERSGHRDRLQGGPRRRVLPPGLSHHPRRARHDGVPLRGRVRRRRGRPRPDRLQPGGRPRQHVPPSPWSP